MSELELYTPSLTDLAVLSSADRWSLEDRVGEWVAGLRDMNDGELRRWVEVEGKTQTEIADLVGLSQQRISQRCKRLGLTSQLSRGGRKPVTSPSNSDEEVTDAEVVEDEPEVLNGEVVEDDDPAARPPEDPNHALLEQIIWWVSDCPDAVNSIPVEDLVATASPEELREWRSGFAKGMTALRALKRRLEPPNNE